MKLVALMKFKNGSLGTIEATTAARPEDFEASLSIVGEFSFGVGPDDIGMRPDVSI